MSRARGLFVTATDTDVGKTLVTAAVASAFQLAGRSVGVLKPAQSGHAADDPAGDTMLLRSWLGHGLDAAPDVQNVCAFEAPLAPLVAARQAGLEISLGAIIERAERMAAAADVLIVEGAGGLLVPVGEAWTIADLALALGYPLIVVARTAVGTVNHTLLTVRVARSLGLRVAAVVLNAHARDADASEGANAELISEFGDVPVLGPLPWLGNEIDGAAIRERLVSLLAAEDVSRLAESAR